MIKTKMALIGSPKMETRVGAIFILQIDCDNYFCVKTTSYVDVKLVTTVCNYCKVISDGYFWTVLNGCF